MHYGRSVKAIREIAAEFGLPLPATPTLLFPYLIGAEGEGEKGGDGSGDGSGGGSGNGSAGDSGSDGGSGDGSNGGSGEGSGDGGSGGEGGGTETFDRAYVESLRKENAGYRTRATKAEKELEEKRKEEMDDLTRSQTERDEEKARADKLEQELADMRMSQAVTLAATGANFFDPQDALSLLNPNDIALDENGIPNRQSVEAAVKRLADSKPHLVKGGVSGSGDGGARGGGGGTVEDKKAEYEQEFKQKGGVPIPK